MKKANNWNEKCIYDLIIHYIEDIIIMIHKNAVERP